MVWASMSANEFRLALTDGYVSQPRGPPREWKAIRKTCEAPLEQRLAMFVNRCATGWHLEPASREELYRDGRIQSQVDVWVVGGPGWVAHAPAAWRAVAQDDAHPEYRMAVVGFDPALEKRRLASYARWLWLGGMRSFKTHGDCGHFRRVGAELLKGLHDYIASTGRPPHEPIASCGAPVYYVGG